MTGTLYRLLKERRKEAERIESAGGKQSAWSKIGMGLGGLLAMGLTGGAATPLVAAMMAGGGTLAGGLLGRGLARGTKGGRIRAGRFYKDEAADLKKSIGESIWSGAGKAALKGGMGALTKAFTVGKEGLKLKEGGANLADLLGKDVPAAAGGYSDSLWGKLGKAVDYKGSFIGKGLPMLQKGATNLAGDVSTGFKNKSMDWSTLPEGMSPRDYQALVGERQASYVASEAASGLDFSTLSSGPSAYDVVNPTAVGEGAVDFRPLENIDEVSLSGRGDYIDPTNIPFQRKPFYASNKEPLSSSLNWRDAGISPYDEYGSWGAHVGKSPVEVARERGDQFYSTRAFEAPNVPIDTEAAIESDFLDKAIPDAVDPGFSGFDESVWTEGRERLAAVTQQRAQDQAKSQAEARYLHAGRGENVWDIVDKGDYQSTMYPFDTSDIGTGLSPFEEKLATQGSGTSFGLSPSNYNLVSDKYRNRLDSLRWQNRLFGD